MQSEVFNTLRSPIRPSAVSNRPEACPMVAEIRFRAILPVAQCACAVLFGGFALWMRDFVLGQPFFDGTLWATTARFHVWPYPYNLWQSPTFRRSSRACWPVCRSTRAGEVSRSGLSCLRHCSSLCCSGTGSATGSTGAGVGPMGRPRPENIPGLCSCSSHCFAQAERTWRSGLRRTTCYRER
jgi:hypothetical protein